MIRWFLRRQIDAFERKWHYNADYVHEMLAIDPRALIVFGKIAGIARYRKDVPLAPHYAAGIVTVMSEDCGPCSQLVIDMAQRRGVEPAVLRALAAKDYAALPEDVALTARFAQASLRRAPEADDLRAEILRRFGRRGLLSIAFAMVNARVYPTLKYAMGYGHACTRLTVAGETRPVLRDMTRAA